MADARPDRWKQIERLYNDAVERDPADRDTFLAQACDDERVREEVRSLLGYEGAANRYLERTALIEAARSLALEAPPTLTGRQISGYDVIALIGAGGMGDVYRARDLRLGRDVALKVLEPSAAADLESRRRFEH